MKLQEVYINLDDSGKLTSKEQVSVYGGLAFFSKAEKDKFITQYRSIINDIKCKYCRQKENCDHNCPELKNTNIKPRHKRRIMNYVKRYLIIALVIRNGKVYSHIMNSKAARGRFTDYAIRRVLKELVKKLIHDKRIDPNLPLRLIINIDEQTTKSNGYYNLHDGLYEELKYGISNYNYSVTFPPIINSDLEIALSYQDSSKSYVVQAADMLAGTIRRVAKEALNDGKNIYEEVSKIADFIIILP